MLVTELGQDRTRVSIEHRHLDRHGAGWEGVHDGVSTEEGWPLYLDRYADLLTSSGRPPQTRRRPMGEAQPI